MAALIKIQCLDLYSVVEVLKWPCCHRVLEFECARGSGRIGKAVGLVLCEEIVILSIYNSEAF